MNLSEFSYHFDALSTVDGTEVIVQKVSEIEKTDMHTHDFIEIVFVRSGCGWHIQGEERKTCFPGSIFVIDMEEEHMFLAEKGERLTVYNLIFHGEFLGIFPIDGKSFSDLIQHFLLRTFQYKDFTHSLAAQFEAKETAMVSNLFERMLAEYAHHEPGFEELIRAWTMELLVYLFRRLSSGEEMGKQEEGFKTDVLADVFAYIQQNYTKNISLNKLATFAFVSPKYFSRLFKIHTGCTVSEYTQKLRIQHACHMLTASNDSVTEIAAQTGYSDVKYFNSVFRRIMGVSPTEYRRKSR